MTRRFLISAIVFNLAAAARGAEPPVGAPLPALLARAGQQVARFWDQFSALTCIESIDQEKLSDDGKVVIKKQNTYDYLVLLQLSGDDMIVDESRVLQGKGAKQSDRALLATSGFSTLLLIFHPRFQNSYTFSDENADAENPALRRVSFEHVHGRRSPSVLQLRSRDYPIEWRGTAWIDGTTGNIARIQVDLKAPMEDVGLRRLASEVRYSPVAFAEGQLSAWMPAVARIDAETTHQHWRNVHQFRGYKQFSVTTDSRTETPKDSVKP